MNNPIITPEMRVAAMRAGRHPASCAHSWQKSPDADETCGNCPATCRRDENGKINYFASDGDRDARIAGEGQVKK